MTAVLVLGGMGTVGRRVVAQFRDQGADARPSGRSTAPLLDGTVRLPGRAARRGGADVAALPDDTHLPRGFPERAVATGVRRVPQLDRSVDVMGWARRQGAGCAVHDSARVDDHPS